MKARTPRQYYLGNQRLNKDTPSATLIDVHIAMLSGEYPPRWGGMGSVVFHLAGHIALSGHKVTVITRTNKTTTSNFNSIPRQEGVDVIEVKWTKLPMAFTKSYGKHALNALLRLHSKEPVDIVHLHCPMISWTKKQFARVRGQVAPIVSSLHGSWLGEKDGIKLAAKHRESATWRNPNDLAILLTAGWYSRYEEAAIHCSDICVANSLATKHDFEARYRPPDEWKCEVIHWGVDDKMFHPLAKDVEEEQLAHEKLRTSFGEPDEAALCGDYNTKTPLILAVGRLVARKGFLTLLKAMPGVLKKHPNAQLVIVGRGHMKSKLMKQAKSLGVGNSVTIKSGMNFDKLAQLFRSSDLVVYPSYYEGQGLIPLEAMASGTPVVTVDYGPLPEMVDEEVGILYKMGDLNSLVNAICSELENSELRQTQAKNGREKIIDKFTYRDNATAFESIYSSLKN